MKKTLSIILSAVIALFIQNISTYNLSFANESGIKFSYNSWDYNNLISYNKMPFCSVSDNDAVIIDANTDNSISKIIDDDFSLEMDLDANAKKQLKPRSNVIDGYKIDFKSSKCVEKVMKPHLKKYKVYEEMNAEELENIDVDSVTDIKEVAKKQKQDRIAKNKQNKKVKPEKRIAWFNIFKRNKAHTIALEDDKNLAVYRDERSGKPSSQPQQLANNDMFDAEKIAEAKANKNELKKQKKEAARITKENLKLAKGTGVNRAGVNAAEEKPVKAAKEKPVRVAEEKPVKVAKEKPVKVAKEKPVKVAKEKPIKIAEEKPVKVAKEKPVKIAKEKPIKVAKEKPVKIAKEKPIKVAEEKPVKVAKEKPVKVAKEKPVKVAKEKPVKVAKGKPIKIAEEKPVKVAKEKPIKVAKEKPVKIAKEKPVKVAKEKPVKVAKEKPVKIAKEKPVKVAKEKPVKVASQVEQKPYINNVTFTTATYNKALGKNVSDKFVQIPTKTQITNKVVAGGSIKSPEPLRVVTTTTTKGQSVKVAKEKPVKVAKEKPVKIAKEKPVKVAKEKPVKVVEEKPVKVAKEKPVKVAKEKPVRVVEEKPVKVAKEKPIKVAKEKPVRVVEEKPVKVVKEKPVKVAKEKPVRVVEEKPVKVAKEKTEFKPIKVEQKISSPVVVSSQEPKPAVNYVAVKQQDAQLASGFKPIKVKPADFDANKQQKEIQQTVYNREDSVVSRTQPEYIPVSGLNPKDMPYKYQVQQETPIYSAYETMQSRLPRTQKSFDTDDI